MFALDIMLVALAQSAVSSAAPPVPRPDVEVVGPSQHNRVICRVIPASGSRIPARQICRTQAEIDEARDRAQSEARTDLASTNRRTNEMQEQSGYGNWLRANQGLVDHPIGITDARQTTRGD